MSRFAFVISVLLTLTTGLFCQETPSEDNNSSSPQRVSPPPKPIFRNYSQRIYLAPDFYYRDYHEKISNGAKSDEMGWLSGFQAGYELLFPFYFGADIRTSSGRTTYDGSIQSFEQGTRNPIFIPHKSYTDNILTSAEYRIGYPITKRSCFFAPFVGSGSHLWSRLAIGGFDYFNEHYSWNYLLTGFVIYNNPQPNILLGLRAEAMYMQNATIVFNNITPFSIPLSLNNRWQYEIETPFGYRFNRWDIRFVPYFRSMDIGKSAPLVLSNGAIFFEPSSTTHVYGFRLELGYLF